MGLLSVPSIDISSLSSPNNSAEKIKTLKAIGDACEEWGFFYIVNHGVDTSLVQKATSLGHKFFEMPKEFKNKVARREVTKIFFSSN
jgi:isopenicillin N synthase-like dioxygenase